MNGGSRRWIGALVLALVLVGCGGNRGGAASPEPQRERALELEPAAMRADMDAWLSTLEAVHPDPFSKLDRATFLRRFEAAKVSLPEEGADPLAFYATVQRLAALLRDSHTGFGYPPDARAYRTPAWPVRTVVRGGRLFVSRSIGALERGTEITKVNEVEASSLLEAATALVSAELPETARLQAPAALWVALWLAGVEAPFRVEGRSPSGAPSRAVLEGHDPAREPPDPPPSSPFALTWPERGVANVTMLAMRGSDEQRFASFIAQATEEIVQKKARGLIVDLRWNDGGSTTLGELLLERLTSKPYRMVSEKRWRASKQYQAYVATLYDPGDDYRLAEPGTTLRFRSEPQPPREVSPRYAGPVCFLIGPGTASAAMMLANAAEDYELAVLIGEPTASPPNYFGELFQFELPRTKLVAGASVAQFVRASGDDSSLLPVQPDLFVAPTQEQWTRGEDPVLARAVAWVKTGQ